MKTGDDLVPRVGCRRNLGVVLLLLLELKFGRFFRSESKKKNLEEIQDQIAIYAKREIKVQKRNKSLKKEIKVLKRNKSPNRKGKIKVQIEKGSKSPDRKGK